MKQRISVWFRARRDERLRRILADCPRSGAELRILDVGGRVAYWERVGLEFLRAQGAKVTLVNVSADEFEPGSAGMTEHPLFERAVGSGCALDYPDGHFDLCHSNSVIEHVGLWRDVEAFARETRRVAKAYYVQSPNYWFPVDPHFWRLPFFHWLPRPIRAGLVQAFPLATFGRAADLTNAYDMVDSARLLTRGQMRHLFPDADILTERVLALPKSFIAVAPRRGHLPTIEKANPIHA